VVTGPNLAEEVVAGLPTATVVASRDPAAASGVRAMVSFPHLRAYTNDDVIGAEVAGAGKNVLALGAGMVDGLGAGDNARAAMVTRGVAELARLGVAAGGQALTFAGLAGLGDIVLTCTSRRSRNWSVGYALGLGHPLQQVLAGLHHVAEGVASAEPVVQLGHRLGVELPICEQVAAVVAGHCTPAQALEALLGREAAEAAHELAGLSGSAGEPPAGM
jgi:glycerol-3-phosphate dehydrogenase (NAD(P)+)